jgi:hypothetical protein
VTQLILGSRWDGVVSYFDSLFNWPPTAQSDQGELIWVAFTIAASMGMMVAFGRWWSR